MRDDQIVMEWVIAVGDMQRWEKLLKNVRKGRYKGMEKAICANNLTSKKVEKKGEKNEQ